MDDIQVLCNCLESLPTNVHIPHNTFYNKNVVVVGGTSGIGRETALIFKKSGANVIITTRYKGGENKMDGMELMELDVTSLDSIKKAVREMKSVDIIIAQGGIFVGGRATDFSDTDAIKTFYTGGGGHINLIREYIKHNHNYPTIICANIGDWALKQPECATDPIDVDIGRLYYSTGKACLYKFITAFNTESKVKYPHITLGFIATENAKTNYAINAEYVNGNSNFAQKLRIYQEQLVADGMDPHRAGQAYVEFCYNVYRHNFAVGYNVKNPNNYPLQRTKPVKIRN